MSWVSRTRSSAYSPVLRCVIFEDEHLLVVNKPAGLNTHAPSPYSGEGIYEWLRHRQARWASLAIMHRLDKETSGLLVFSKTPLASRSLTAQFTARSVRKRYLLLTDRPVQQKEVVVKSALIRAGERYVSRPLHAGGPEAETRFRECRMKNEECRSSVSCRMLEAEPLTGRTHQIRVHAADSGFPILGDTLYGGTPAARVCLHAAALTLKHPASGEEMTFRAPVGTSDGLKVHHSEAASTPLPFRRGEGESPAANGAIGSRASYEAASAGGAAFGLTEAEMGLSWGRDPLPCLALRQGLIDPGATDAYRVIHGASDGRPGWYVDRLGDFLLSQGVEEPGPAQREELERLGKAFAARGVYHKLLTRQVGRTARAEASPRLVLGEAAPERFTVRENGVRFELSFSEGYSAGLFLDQRDNRRRLLTRHVAADFPLLALPSGNRQWEVLNTFAYTCAFSVCAAKAGARTTSIDLSKRYLERGQRNFALNQLDLAEHEFLHGDAMDWLRRLAKKKRCFDVVLLDPPTFSQSKASGVFRAEKDYGRLVAAALPVLRTGGVLFASTNAAGWAPEHFLGSVQKPIHAADRKILQCHYVPQPPDFPVSKAEPAYLKTVWLRVG
jgi:23S rRNA (cytosine1962-C5)-methyltransferase